MSDAPLVAVRLQALGSPQDVRAACAVLVNDATSRGMHVAFEDAPALLADGDGRLDVGVPVSSAADARALVTWLIDAVPDGRNLFTIIPHG
jgi:hypothetical protein